MVHVHKIRCFRYIKSLYSWHNSNYWKQELFIILAQTVYIFRMKLLEFLLFGSENLISSNLAVMYYENKISEKLGLETWKGRYSFLETLEPEKKVGS